MTSERKTILFVMPRLPYPTTSGRKTSLFHYCRILSEELKCRVVVAAFLEDGDVPEQIPSFIDRLVVLPRPSLLEKAKNIILLSFVMKKYPLQVSLYLSKKAKTIINNLVNEENPDIVIGDMVRSTEYIKDISAYRIADLDDRISFRYQRQVDKAFNRINPYGAFLNSVPRWFRAVMLLRPIKSAVVKSEIKLLRTYELKIGLVCEKTVFVAESEARQFNSELGEDKAIAIPIGVDIEKFSYRKTGTSKNYIGFLGAMSVAHNEDSVRHFILDILPSVIKRCPDAKFIVIGGGVSEELKNLSSDNVEFTGKVEDVRRFLQKCKVFVCPMIFGSGIKTKNLEAMSLGLPVVTSTIGAENINAANGHEWIIADNDEDFANAIVELLGNDERRESIGKNGSNYIARNFTWNLAKKRFEEVLMDVQ